MRCLKIVSVFFLLAAASAYAETSPLIGSWVSHCDDEANGSSQSRVVFQADGMVLSSDLTYAEKNCQGTSEISETLTEPYRVSSETTDRAVLSTLVQRGENGESLEMEAEFTFPVENRMEMRVLKIIAHLEHEGDISMDALVAITPVLTFTRE